MALPHDALVLVADGRKYLFLRNHGDQAVIDLRTESHEVREDSPDRDLRTDAPGTNFQSFSTRRSSYEETDFHQLEEDRWAKDVAELLNKRALNGDFGALAIVAPPKTLGELRKHFHKEVERRLVAEINKEMTDRPVDQIEALLRGQAAPPA